MFACVCVGDGSGLGLGAAREERSTKESRTLKNSVVDVLGGRCADCREEAAKETNMFAYPTEARLTLQLLGNPTVLDMCDCADVEARVRGDNSKGLHGASKPGCTFYAHIATHVFGLKAGGKKSPFVGQTLPVTVWFYWCVCVKCVNGWIERTNSLAGGR